MGWTEYPEGLRGRTPDQEFRELLTAGGRQEVLLSATVHLSEYYAAVRDLGSGEVSAFVALHHYSRGGSWGYKDMDERMGPTITGCPERVVSLLSPLPECQHRDEHCVHCGSLIEAEGGEWVRRPRRGERAGVAGPHCYSGYSGSAPVDAAVGRPRHAPGGLPPCGTCQARDWRERCRRELQRQRERPRVGELVRLLHREAFRDGLPEVFRVCRQGRRRVFVGAEGGPAYRFPQAAEWERVG